MLKVGIIGLGDIATKAYLPVMGRRNLEVHLFTRNENRLQELSAGYRFPHKHSSMDSFLNSGIKAAFVHTATASHDEIVQQLLENNIHVYVDKPVTYDFASTSKLVALADQKNLILMAGFNRRYAPAYANLKNLKDPNMILMQKNRKSLPGDIRSFVFDDFIHVVDTLLFLLPQQIGKMTVNGRMSGGLLHHVVVQFESGTGTTAIGIMNRDSGTVEERLEVSTSSEKWVVSNVTDTTVLKDSHAMHHRLSDWESTLYRRGFEQITDSFLHAVINEASPKQIHRDILRTHEVCERIVQALLPA